MCTHCVTATAGRCRGCATSICSACRAEDWPVLCSRCATDVEQFLRELAQEDLVMLVRRQLHILDDTTSMAS
jgi:hypothetical protein